MADWTFLENNKEPFLSKWRQAVRGGIPAFPCTDTIELQAQTFDYQSKLGVMCAMSILTQNIEQFFWPENWVEAVKARWMPIFLRQLWPVKYTRIEVSAIYPKAKLPDPVFKATQVDYASKNAKA